jgi:phosphate uptake regulator
MALVAQFYERLGDHAVNIARPGVLPGRDNDRHNGVTRRYRIG